jgi:hypothetical protein|tara:strand:+ start:291 stop:1442 length:1152 start_codon:yes stop_codon:yes gene_type:complete
MAVNIDTVYQRVLAIANKEQRGYITPQEFNLLANQVQMSMFEEYFYDIDEMGKRHGNDTEYSDRLDNLNEKISIFSMQDVVLANSGGAELITNGEFDSNIDGWTVISNPGDGTVAWEQASANNNYDSSLSLTQSSGSAIAVTQSFTTVATQQYVVEAYVSGIIDGGGGVYPEEPIYQVSVRNAAGSISLGLESGFAVAGEVIRFEFTAQDATSVIYLYNTATNDVGHTIKFGRVSIKKKSTEYTLPSDLYRFGTLLVSDKEAEQVLPNELRYINAAPLTKPTASRPIYTRKNLNAVNVYPETITSGVTCNYVRKPSTAEWDYVVINEKALYNATGATNFELHPSEETYIVIRILELAGVILNKPGLSQIASQEEMQIAATQKK